MPKTDGGSGPVVDVLLVEDDPGDVQLTREAFEHRQKEECPCFHAPR